MVAFSFFDCFFEDVAEKVHNLGSDAIKAVLSNTAPNLSTMTGLADVTQIANGNGYTTGGAAATVSSSAQTSGTYKLVLADVVWNASGTMGPFRYVYFYNDTSSGDKLIGVYDKGSSITLENGESFTTDLDGTNGIIQMHA